MKTLYERMEAIEEGMAAVLVGVPIAIFTVAAIGTAVTNKLDKRTVEKFIEKHKGEKADFSTKGMQFDNMIGLEYFKKNIFTKDILAQFVKSDTNFFKNITTKVTKEMLNCGNNSEDTENDYKDTYVSTIKDTTKAISLKKLIFFGYIRGLNRGKTMINNNDVLFFIDQTDNIYKVDMAQGEIEPAEFKSFINGSVDEIATYIKKNV